MKKPLSQCFESSREGAHALLRWLILALPTGVVCGTLGAAFHILVDLVTHLRTANPWIVWLLPLAGLAIVALYKLTGCAGVGTDNVIRAVRKGEPLPLLLVPAVFFGTVLTHLCGGSSGREGAALQMGGSIGWCLGGLLRLSPHDRRTATMCGMAAFFSALFGTPLTAMFFATMVTDVGLVFLSGYLPSLLAAVVAYGISLRFGVHTTHFHIPVAPALSARSILQVTVLAIGCAGVARLFCLVLHGLEHRLPRLLPNPWLRTFVGGLAVAALSYLMGLGRYNGAGVDVITAAIEQQQALPWDFACKLLLTALTLACGFKGGEVIPSFFIGATFGCVVGPLLGLPAGFAAAVGLVAVFCGCTNTLVPSVLLGIELFGGEAMLLLALGCGVCYAMSGYHGFYESQRLLTDKLISEYHEAEPAHTPPQTPAHPR